MLGTSRRKTPFRPRGQPSEPAPVACKCNPCREDANAPTTDEPLKSDAAQQNLSVRILDRRDRTYAVVPRRAEPTEEPKCDRTAPSGPKNEIATQTYPH